MMWQKAADVGERISKSHILRNRPISRVAFGALHAQVKSIQDALALNNNSEGRPINVAIISPTTSVVGILTTNWEKVDHAMKESLAAAQRLFGRIGQQVFSESVQQVA